MHYYNNTSREQHYRCRKIHICKIHIREEDRRRPLESNWKWHHRVLKKVVEEDAQQMNHSFFCNFLAFSQCLEMVQNVSFSFGVVFFSVSFETNLLEIVSFGTKLKIVYLIWNCLIMFCNWDKTSSIRHFLYFIKWYVILVIF